MFTEVIGISILLGKQYLFRFLIHIICDLCVKIFVSTLGIIFSRHHLVCHILRNAKHLSGSKAHIQMVAVNAILYKLERIPCLNMYFFVVREDRSTCGNSLFPYPLQPVWILPAGT